MLPSTTGLLALLSLCAGSVQARSFDLGLPKYIELDVTWDKGSPAGIERNLLLVNGQFPAPTIELEQDDHVIVKLHNNSPFNTSLHFHGIEMHRTPWSDGVPGVTQRPIQPGESFTYEFHATQYGSYWYHAHFRGQIEDGMYGPVVIHPRKHEPNPFHLISNDSKVVRKMEEAERKVQPLLIADMSHLTSFVKWQTTLDAGTEVSCFDSIIFNGKGNVNCLPEKEVTAHLTDVQKGYLDLIPGSKMTDKACLPVDVMDAFGGSTGTPEKMMPGVFEGCNATQGSTETISIKKSDCDQGAWVAIDIIGAINFITTVVSIDEHDMWVYAMDGSYIKPQKVQALVLTNGDRYSVLVKPTKAGDYKIRANANSAPQMIVGNAVLSVTSDHPPSNQTESKPYIDIIGTPLSKDVVLFDQATASPYPPVSIPKKSDASYVLRMKVDGGSYLWAMNETRWMPNTMDTVAALPTLFDPHPGLQNNVTISTKNGTWVDLVLLANAFPMPPHPIHKHGVKMYQIGQGTGKFTWRSVNEAIHEKPELFNLVNPPRRDAFASPATSTEVAWVVVRYQVVDPGTWLLHCHIQNHLEGGMMMVIQDGVDAWPKIPAQYYPD